MAAIEKSEENNEEKVQRDGKSNLIDYIVGKKVKKTVEEVKAKSKIIFIYFFNFFNKK